jgi:hypothetical protein
MNTFFDERVILPKFYILNERFEEIHKEFMYFWGRIPHKVENNLSTPRYAICFDVKISRESLLNI